VTSPLRTRIPVGRGVRGCLFALAIALVALRAGPSGAVGTGRGTPVAVLYFENTGNPDLEMLKIGLAQMLVSDLQGTPGIEVIERARLQAVIDELALSRGDLVDPATAARVGKLLGARLLVLGAYFELFGTLRVDARVVEVETSRVLVSAGAEGPRASFGRVEDEVAARLRQSFADLLPDRPAGSDPALPAGTGTGRGAGTAPVAGRPEAGGNSGGPPEARDRGSVDAPAGGPQPLEAALSFSKGLEFLDRKDLVRAREALSRAVELDPGLDDARAVLAGLGS